jgi:hypothetical protein
VENWKSVYDDLVDDEATCWVGGVADIATSMREALDGDIALALHSHQATLFVEAGDAAARAIPDQVLALIP